MLEDEIQVNNVENFSSAQLRKKKDCPPGVQVHVLLQGSEREHRTHAFLTGADSTLQCVLSPHPKPASVLEFSKECRDKLSSKQEFNSR